MYKPGQLITIYNKVYRIKKAASGCTACDYIYLELCGKKAKE